MIKQLLAFVLSIVAVSHVAICAEGVLSDEVKMQEVAEQVSTVFAQAREAGLSDEEAIDAVAESLETEAASWSFSKKDLLFFVSGIALGVVSSCVAYKLYQYCSKQEVQGALVSDSSNSVIPVLVGQATPVQLEVTQPASVSLVTPVQSEPRAVNPLPVDDEGLPVLALRSREQMLADHAAELAWLRAAPGLARRIPGVEKRHVGELRDAGYAV